LLFNSVEFVFFFLPITLFIFFMIGNRGNHKLAIAWVIAASLFFYGWWNPIYLGLLILSILFNYVVGCGMNQRGTIPISKRLFLILGILGNLLTLGYFKYVNFFVANLNNFTGTSFHLNQIVLPLAISFFTFEQIAFLVDVYRGETREYSFLNYCLFVTFFPRLLAGPIIRHQEVIPQFSQKAIYQFNPEDVAVGLTIFLLGLGKKVLLADNIVAYANPVFNAASEGIPLTFYEAWIGALAYSFQLYFDFSGYSDMAIGIARMFGIKLPLNFDSPYKAVNIINFWRRWHITLSNFLRDYLYIPLGGNRQGEFRRHLNLMITMLLGGLWHGAGWTFVFWGGLHGIYLCINHQWRAFRKLLGHDLRKSNWWSRSLGCIITFVAVVVAWVFFRAENIKVALAIIKPMFGTKGFSFSSYVVPSVKQELLKYLILIWFLPNTQQWLFKYRPSLTQPLSDLSSSWYNRLSSKFQWQPNTTFGLILGILAFIVTKTLLNAPQSEFLYFNF
jgi:alginate O-acetyltransferase complex protein AlgI